MKKVMAVNGRNIFDFNIVNVNDLTLIDKKSVESNVYHNDFEAYKLYKGLDSIELKEKKQKLKLLKEIDMKELITPKVLLYKNFRFCGYSMDYFDTLTLWDLYENIKLSDFLKILINISYTTKNIHSLGNDICIADFHFQNILIDDNLKHHFCDIDSFKMGNLECNCMPFFLNCYTWFRNINIDRFSDLTDRLCLYLNLFYLIFKKPVDIISLCEYEKKAERSRYLRILKPLFLEIKRAPDLIDLPYLHEIFNEKKDIIEGDKNELLYRRRNV